MKDPNEDALTQHEAEEDYLDYLDACRELRKHQIVKSLRDDPAGVSEELTESLSTYISDGSGDFFVKLLTDDVEGVVEELDEWVDWHIDKGDE